MEKTQFLVEKLGLFDEKTGDFHHVAYNLKDLKKGWNHAVVNYDNEKLNFPIILRKN